MAGITKMNSTALFSSPAAAAVMASLPLLLYYTYTRMGPSTSKDQADTTAQRNAKTDAKTTPLLQLAIEGKIDDIKSIIAQNISSSSDSGKDVITTATSGEQREKMQSIVNQSDGEGNTPLIGAVFSGHLELVRYLVNDVRADISLQNKMKCSPMWIAAGYGHVDILRYLIDTVRSRGDDGPETLLRMLRQGNNTDDTPLLAAVSKGHVDVCRLILESAHDSDHYYQLLCGRNKAGDTPLSVCVGFGHDGPLLNLLLDWEEKQIRKCQQSRETHQQPQQQRPLNAKNSKGLTPLLIACERNLASAVEELIIRRGASTSVSDEKGMSPLAVAAFCGCEDVVRRIISILPNETNANEEKTNSNDENCIVTLGSEMLDQGDKNGCTPLWLAARTGNAKMVQILVEAGADVTKKNNSDRLTPEEVAIKFKKTQVIDYFRQLVA